MKKYEAYIHSNGTLMVKELFFWVDTTVDQDSPFVKKYLGTVDAESRNKAKLYFQQKIRKQNDDSAD